MFYFNVVEEKDPNIRKNKLPNKLQSKNQNNKKDQGGIKRGSDTPRMSSSNNLLRAKGMSSTMTIS